MQNYLAAAIACGLVGVVLSVAELQRWRGLRKAAAYAGGGFMCSLFAASPVMWQWLGLYAEATDQLAMAIALGVGLWVTVDVLKRWVL